MTPQEYFQIEKEKIIERPTPSYFAELLKETKKAHLNFQKETGNKASWATWYAAYMTKKVEERFGNKYLKTITQEFLLEALEEAEHAHTREWPEYFGQFILEKVGYTFPDSLKEFPWRITGEHLKKTKDAQQNQETDQPKPELTPNYLAWLFRKTKRAHLRAQEMVRKEKNNPNLKLPWPAWYADYVDQELQTVFGKEAADKFKEVNLPDLLDEAENTHSEDWRNYYGELIISKMNSTTKENLPPTEKEPAVKKGVGLTPEELIERDGIIKTIDEIVKNWVKETTSEEEGFNTDKMAKLVKHLGIEYGNLLDSIIDKFSDPTKYPDRPGVKIVEGNTQTPDIWLLGWREKDKDIEMTDIHDHLNSEAAVYVYKGNVHEIIYAIDKEQWYKDNSELDFQIAARGLMQESTITIEAPYIHLVCGKPDQQCGVTIHAYYPPLKEMNFFEEKDGKLVKTGHWKEDDGCSCNTNPNKEDQA